MSLRPPQLCSPEWLISAETLPQLLPPKENGSAPDPYLMDLLVPAPRVELGTY